ncbi:MAG: tetratricopeptide repeat protein [Parcubacteria group bacterium]|nr:tetratricopeptide repeat protein [Parcubacteria group bacterium]
MFKLNKKLLVGVGVVLVLALIIIADRLLKKPALPPDNTPTALEHNSQDIAGNVPRESVQKPSGKSGQLSQIPPYSGRPLSEVRFGQGFSAPQERISQQRRDLALLAAVLTAQPLGAEGVNDWIALGSIKKFFNDYEGAKDAWEYAGVLYPGNALSFANLGHLYGFYLGDAAKAENSFRRAIDSDPYQPSYYIGLADLYRHAYASKKSEAPKVLLEGMSVIGDANLVLSLATFYRDEGDKTNAVKYYEEVLKIAPDQAGVREEIDRLSN